MQLQEGSYMKVNIRYGDDVEYETYKVTKSAIYDSDGKAVDLSKGLDIDDFYIEGIYSSDDDSRTAETSVEGVIDYVYNTVTTQEEEIGSR